MTDSIGDYILSWIKVATPLYFSCLALDSSPLLTCSDTIVVNVLEAT